VLRLTRPTPDQVRAHLATQADLPFTYDAVGATRDERSPDGYVHDHNRQQLGMGAEAFARGCDAIRAWTMFPAPLAWIEPLPIAIREGELAGVVIRALGLWWLNAARIAYVIDEPRRFGFAYGTLPGHVERGEERFLVEWLPDDTVWYDLRAFSQPRYWMVRLGKPIARHLQRRFGRLSKAAMLRAVEDVRSKSNLL
jgi:uncharacterized protein (UPF0548 family)